jgi:hypothetical protein
MGKSQNVVSSERLRRSGELEGHEDTSAHSLDNSVEEERHKGGQAAVSTSGRSNGGAECSGGGKIIEWGGVM